MRRALLVLALAPLLAGACSPQPSGTTGSTGTPAPSAGAAARGGLSGEACRVLTTADVQAALGVPVNQLPMSSPPPGGGPGGTLISGCNYASATSASTGVSLLLFRDLPIDFYGSIPGYQKVAGIGDRAYVQPPLLVGQKGSTTFQLIIVATGDDTARDQQLRTLARAVAGRL
jgi:hypothetical protein